MRRSDTPRVRMSTKLPEYRYLRRVLQNTLSYMDCTCERENCVADVWTSMGEGSGIEARRETREAGVREGGFE